MTYLDPQQFIITRKRKKYRFAKFHNATNCYEYDEWCQAAPEVRQSATVLEVGAGTGMFSVELAAQHPDEVFVALDVKGDRLQKGAYAALERGITNVLFVRARADQIGELFAAHSLKQLWVTFPDPFPKRRSAGRRLTHPTFLRSTSSCYGRVARSCSSMTIVISFVGAWSSSSLKSGRFANYPLISTSRHYLMNTRRSPPTNSAG